MFRKLVSNLPFSPALLHDVGFYASRLRKEEITRRATVFFVALALIMQSLAVFSPPESANASSEQDIIRGGVSNFEDFMTRYDRNDDDLRDILTAAGINREELVSTKAGTITTADNTYILTRYGHLSSSDKEASLQYQRSVGGVGVRYLSPLADVSTGSIQFEGWIGNSEQIGWFGIVKSNGGLVTRGLPATIAPSVTPETTIVKTVSATNLSQGKLTLSSDTAKPLDKIAYTLKASNTSQSTASTQFSIRLSDVAEYASVIDAGGGIYDVASGTLSWSPVQLRKGETQERTFVVQLHSQLSATATGQSNPGSYDCVMALSYGQHIQIPVECPPVKAAESLLSSTPAAGIAINIMFAALISTTALYFYVRTRQLKKEIRIIRHDLNAGII